MIRSRRFRNERGATLVEVLVVLAILSVLANIAIPGLIYALKRAEAAAILGDFTLVRQAVIEYYRDHGELPPDVNRGIAPPQLAAYLDGKVDFKTDTYWYDWENWEGHRGRFNRRFGVKTGLSVRTNDLELLAMLDRMYDGPTQRCNENGLMRTCFNLVIEPNAE